MEPFNPVFYVYWCNWKAKCCLLADQLIDHMMNVKNYKVVISINIIILNPYSDILLHVSFRMNDTKTHLSKTISYKIG